MPPGTIITFSKQTEKAASVSGFIPMEFKKAVAFFQSKLPAEGYQLLEGDAEMDEAESTFSGHGFYGKWKVNGILQLSGSRDTQGCRVEVLDCDQVAKVVNV